MVVIAVVVVIVVVIFNHEAEVMPRGSRAVFVRVLAVSVADPWSRLPVAFLWLNLCRLDDFYRGHIAKVWLLSQKTLASAPRGSSV